MKILYVTNMYPSAKRPWYGIFVKEQIDALKRNFSDIEADVYFMNGADSKWSYVRSVFEINRKIKKGGYDLVHIHYGLSGLFLLMPFRPKIPVIATLHGGDIQIDQGKYVQVALTKKILGRCDAAISLNDKMTSVVSRYCRDTTQIPCSVDTDLFCPAGRRQPLKGRRRFTVLFPSDRSRFIKNYPLFCETVDYLRKEKGLEIDTVELSNMSRREIAAHMQKADFLLMTSISEGSPQTVKEAMACNLPVITTRVGDVDWLLDGVRDSGWVEQHESKALAEKMMSAINGDISGREARERLIELQLNDNKTAARIYGIYKRLLS